MSKNVKWIALFVMIVAVTCAIVCVNGTFDNEQNNTDDDSTIPSVTPIPTPTTPEDPEEEEHSYMTTVYDSNNNEYTVSSGVLTITKGTSGTGIMPNFSTSSTVRTLVGEDFTSVIIGNGMRSVGYCAFYRYSYLTSATIGNDVTSFNYRAFYQCTSLTSVTIEGNVISFGSGVFYCCTSLTSVTIQSTTPASLMGSNVFPGNSIICVPSSAVSTYRSSWSSYSSQIFDDTVHAVIITETSTPTLTVDGTVYTTSDTIPFINGDTYVFTPSTYSDNIDIEFYEYLGSDTFNPMSGTITGKCISFIALRLADASGGNYVRISPYTQTGGNYDYIIIEESTTSCNINVGGVWKSGTPYVNVNGTWKEGVMYVNVNGTWKQGG